MQLLGRRITCAFSLSTPAFRRLLALPLLVCLAFVPAWADQLVMKNGDRVTGSVVKKTGKDLTIKTDQLGSVTVAWDQVASIKTDKPINVVLADGRTVKGILATNGAMVEIAAQQPVRVAPGDITALRDDAEQKAFDRLQHPRLTELWAA